MPPPPAIINPLTGSSNTGPSWYPNTWGTTNYTAPTVNYGASGVAPAGGMNLTSLTNYINSLGAQEQSAALSERIPQETALEKISSGNIASELAGEVSPTTIRLLQQQAPERGVTTGAGPASDNTNAAYLQALGLTSEQLQQEGQRDLTAAEQRNPAAPLFDPSTQLLTPYQAGILDIKRAQLAQESGGGGGYAAPRINYVGGDPQGTFAPTSTSTSLPYVAPTDPTATWLQSIGFTDAGFPGPTGVAGEQGQTLFDYGNVQVPGAISPATPAQEAPLSYADIFGPDLSTLYGPAASDLGPTGG